MVAELKYNHMTPQEYLEWEPKQLGRHEYIDGEVYAMSGGTKPHNRIGGNLYIAIDHHLQNRGCEVYFSDVKVKVSPTSSYHYPDIVVTCDERDRESNQVVLYPCVVVEVLSPSTEAYDRGGKFSFFRRISTLQEYVLLESERIGCECFRRNDQGLWVLHPFETDDTLTLESIDFSIPMRSLYRQVNFDEYPESSL
jgi:Uma2 family endonuclease